MTKIDIISGFLGAGKTTFIKKLIEEELKDTNVVLIENEFGVIGIDGGFLKESGIQMKEMNSGCICCSLVGDFGTSLKEVVETYHPERILIEPSGVGKLSDVITAIEKIPSELGLQLNSAAVVVDATKCKMYSKNFGEFFINQIANAKTVILSRTEHISEEKIKQCLDIIRTYNDHSPIITTPWEQLEAKDMLRTMEEPEQLAEELLEECSCGHHHEHKEGEGCGCGHHHEHEEGEGCGCGHHHEHEEGEGCGCGHHHEHEEGESCGCGHDHHHADEVFTSWGMETPLAYSKEEITTLLEALEDEKMYGMVLRAKGMVPGTEGEWVYFDYVPGECDVRSGKPQITGKLCVIGSKLEEANLTTLFQK